jgi:hypothetical protein
MSSTGKFKDEPEMEYDTRQYERLSEGHPDKIYEHLKSRVYLVIRMQEQKKNLHEREALLSAKPLKGQDVSGTMVPVAPGVEKATKDQRQIKIQMKRQAVRQCRPLVAQQPHQEAARQQKPNQRAKMQKGTKQTREIIAGLSKTTTMRRLAHRHSLLFHVSSFIAQSVTKKHLVCILMHR